MTYDASPRYARVDVSEDGRAIAGYAATVEELSSLSTEQFAERFGEAEGEGAEYVTVTNKYAGLGRLKVTKHLVNVALADLTNAEKAAMTFTVTWPNGFSASNTLDKFTVAEG